MMQVSLINGTYILIITGVFILASIAFLPDSECGFLTMKKINENGEVEYVPQTVRGLLI